MTTPESENQAFLSSLRADLVTFFELYHKYADSSNSTSETVKLLEDLAALSFTIATDLWIKTRPVVEDTVSKSIADSFLPPVDIENLHID